MMETAEAVAGPSFTTTPPLKSSLRKEKLTFNSEEIRNLSKTRSSQVRLPDLAHQDSLKNVIPIPERLRKNGDDDSPKAVPDSRQASLFLAYIQEQDESSAELTLYNDVDFEPCPSWDFVYTNVVIPSEEIKQIDLQHKEAGWPYPHRQGELIQGGIRRCSCGDGDDGDEECDESRCACQKILEDNDAWYQEGKDGFPFRGRFPYTPEGRLRHESYISYPHLCIFECTKACGCGDDCPNRVVQRGRTVPLEIFKTQACGWGVRTRKAVKAGTFITIYAGEVVTNAEAEQRTNVYDSKLGTTYVFDLDSHLAEDWANRPDMAKDLNLDLDSLTEEEVQKYMELWQQRSDRNDRYPSIDAGLWGNVSRFLNHSCDPNLGIYFAYIDEVFDVHRPLICFFTRRDVSEGEELTFSYTEPPTDEEAKAAQEKVAQGQREEVTITNDKVGELFLKPCRCGARNCNGFMWRSPTERSGETNEDNRGGDGATVEAAGTTVGRSGTNEAGQVPSTPYRVRGKVPKLTPSHSSRPMEENEEMEVLAVFKGVDGESSDVAMRDEVMIKSEGDHEGGGKGVDVETAILPEETTSSTSLSHEATSSQSHPADPAILQGQSQKPA